jgi:PAS domain S-box-containing protein
MNGKINNILKLICGMNGSNFGLLIKIGRDDYSVRAVHGELNIDNSLLKNFCDDLRFTQNFDPAEVVQFDSYLKLAELLNLKALGIKEIYNSANFSLLLICFSKESEFKSIEISNMDTASEILFEFIEDEKSYDGEYSMQRTIENANLAVLFSDYDGNAVFTNNRFKETFNFDTQTEFTDDSLKLFDEDGNFLENFDYPYKIAVRKNKSISDKKYKYINDNGEEKWFRVNSIIVPDNNAAAKVLTTFEDITTVMDIKQRMKSDMAPPEVIYYSSDPSGTEYTFISDSAKKLFGYLPEEIFDNKFMIISRIFPEYLKAYKNFIRDVSRGSQLAIEYKINDAKNNVRFVRHLGIPVLENYEVVKIVGVITDITNEKKITEKLLFAEEKLNLVLDNSDEFIFSLNEQFQFEIINQLGARFLGYEPEELIGNEISDFLRDENKNQVNEIIDEIKNSDSLKLFNANFKAKNNKTVQIEIKAKSIKFGDEGKTIIGVGRNISEYNKDELKIKELTHKLNEANQNIEREMRKNNQQLNIAEELNRLKNDFISSISHELRTPLTSIVGFADTISSDTELDRNVITEFGKVILEEGNRLSRLIDEILDFSEYEAGIKELKKSNFNLFELVNQLKRAFDSQFNDKNIALELTMEGSNLNLTGDRIALYKAFSNLLSNALKFTNSGGKVDISIIDKDELIEFIIADTGVGIHEADISKLFQKFRKLNRAGSQLPGAGFGLVTVQQIIELHFGTIKIESKLNKGTKITVRIPKNLTSGGK